jgi:drug/metabolite transporter (DMT)-like permease
VLGIALALASSLSWGVADFIGGTQSRRLAVLTVVLVSQASGLVVLGLVLAARGRGAPALEHLLPAAAGGIAGLVGLGAFYRGLALGTMSIVAPIAATGVALPVLVGVAGGDRPAALQLVGIAAAVIGVALASLERPEGAAARSVARESVALALLAAVGFGLFFVGMRSSARSDPLWATFAARTASVIALLALTAWRRPPLGQARGSWALLCVAGTLDVGANVLYAIATRHGLLSVVSVLSSLYPLATVALARLLLGERVRRVQEVGVAAALAGVLLIAAG